MVIIEKKADEKSKMFNKLQTSTKHNIMQRTSLSCLFLFIVTMVMVTLSNEKKNKFFFSFISILFKSSFVQTFLFFFRHIVIHNLYGSRITLNIIYDGFLVNDDAFINH